MFGPEPRKRRLNTALVLTVIAMSFSLVTSGRFVPDPPTLSICSPKRNADGSFPQFDLYTKLTVAWSAYNLFSTTSFTLQILREGAIVRNITSVSAAAATTDIFLFRHLNQSDTARYSLRLGSDQESVSATSDTFYLSGSNPYRIFSPGVPTEPATASSGMSFNVYYKGIRNQGVYYWSDLNFTAPEFRMTSVGILIARRPVSDLNNLRLGLAWTKQTAIASNFQTTSVVHGPMSHAYTDFVNGQYFDVPLSSEWVWTSDNNLLVDWSFMNDQYYGSIGVSSGTSNINRIKSTTLRFIRSSSDTWGQVYPPDTTSSSSNFYTEYFLPTLRFGGYLPAGDRSCGSIRFQSPPNPYSWTQLTGSADSRADCLDPSLPNCRSGHSLVSFTLSSGAPGLLLFGGSITTAKGSESLNDLWYFNGTAWSMLAASNCLGSGIPACRFAHKAAVLGDHMYVIGGVTDAAPSRDSALWAVSISGALNRQIVWRTRGVNRVREHIYSSLVSDGVSKLFLFGGSAWSPTALRFYDTNQLFQFDNTTQAWTGLFPSVADLTTNQCIQNTVPCSNSHAMAIYRNEIFVFGGSSGSNLYTNGAFKFSLATNTWTALFPGSCSDRNAVECRYGANGFIRPPSTLIITGGYTDRSEFTNDVWELDFSAQPGNWLRVIQSDCGSSSRYPCQVEASAALLNFSLAVFGGYRQLPGSFFQFNSLFEYRPIPVIATTSDQLLSRPTSGGDPITITGLYFGARIDRIKLQLSNSQRDMTLMGANNLRFVGNNASVRSQDSSGLSDFALVFTPPPGTGVNVTASITVSVFGSVTSTTVQLYSYAPPVIRSISTAISPTRGGIWMNLTGDNFGPQDIRTQILVGGQLGCDRQVFVNHSYLGCLLSPGLGSRLPITIRVGNQISDPAQSTLTFLPPVITGLTPNTAVDTEGGAVITVQGTDFGDPRIRGVEAYVGNQSCTSIPSSDHEFITCVVPPGAGSSVSVSVVVGGQRAAQTGFSVAYRKPSLANITYDPEFATDQRGKGTVIVSGSNLGPAWSRRTVMIGNQPCLTTEGSQTSLTCVTPPISSSQPAVDLPVTVFVADQRSDPVASLTFAYKNPEIQRLDTHGSSLATEGNVTIDIFGSQLGTSDVVPTIYVGGKRCLTVLYVSVRQVTCLTPEGDGSNLPVTVELAGLRSDASSGSSIFFSYDLPDISRWSGVQAPTRGSSSIVLEGKNFGPLAGGSPIRAFVNGEPCVSTARRGHRSLECVVPAGAGKQLPLSVEVNGQRSSVFASTFSYESPSIDQVIVLGTLGTEGGATLRLSGKNFGLPTSSVSVQIDGKPCRNMMYISHELVECIVPEGAGRNLPVTVTVEGQTSAVSASLNVSYDGPLIRGVMLDRAPDRSGRGKLHVYGNNFGPASAGAVVYLGDTACLTRWMNHSHLEAQLGSGVGSGLTVSVLVANQSSVDTPPSTDGSTTGSATILSYPPPEIYTVLPSEVALRSKTVVTVTGAYFGESETQIQAFIGTYACESVRLIATFIEFTCTAPAMATEQSLNLIVTVAGQRSNTLVLRYVLPALSPVLRLSMIGLAAFCQLLLLATLIAVLYFREAKDIKASSPIFSSLSLVGAIAVLGAIYGIDPQTLNVLCQPAIALVLIGFTFLFGALFLKNYRILRIFRSGEGSLKVKIISDVVLFLWFGILLLVDCGAIAAVFAMHSCSDELNTNVLAILGGLLGIKAGLLLAGVVVAFKSRVISIERFNERQQLGIAIYNIAVCVVIILPISFLFSKEAVAVYVIRSLGLVFCTMVSTSVLFIPKFHQLYLTRKEESKAAEIPLQERRGNRETVESSRGSSSAKKHKPSSGGSGMSTSGSSGSSGRSGARTPSKNFAALAQQQSAPPPPSSFGLGPPATSSSSVEDDTEATANPAYLLSASTTSDV